MIIKIILITSVLIAAFFLVRSTGNTKNVALRRLLLLIFVILAIFSILFPRITTLVANAIGIGRGTDLLLYLLIIAFLSYSVVMFRRLNILENRIVKLSRQLTIAISDPAKLSDPENPDSSTP
ncbi:DUF2304 domain-containing protein [uncultured Arcanobacterium sp.]|uniref:DUF2304 domain-containing protein n=1 Tax=uncultured Arcanobacterium sp. TaxID=487520 RepID=UPI002610C341|nr:DUF2304 domain-containing protein [uncultured Arcanobacterium sp.]